MLNKLKLESVYEMLTMERWTKLQRILTGGIQNVAIGRINGIFRRNIKSVRNNDVT